MQANKISFCLLYLFDWLASIILPYVLVFGFDPRARKMKKFFANRKKLPLLSNWQAGESWTYYVSRLIIWRVWGNLETGSVNPPSTLLFVLPETKTLHAKNELEVVVFIDIRIICLRLYTLFRRSNRTPIHFFGNIVFCVQQGNWWKAIWSGACIV